MRRGLVLLLGVLPLAMAARPYGHSPQNLPVFGGSGGTSFTKDCGTGSVLTGLRYRASLLVDAIGIMCRPVAANGSLGPETTVGSLAGGGGGTSGAVSCPAGQVAAGAGVLFGTYVNEFVLWCRPWSASSRSFGGSTTTERGAYAGSSTLPGTFSKEYCEAGSQPVRAIRGRSAMYVDAIGAICNEP